MAGVVGGRHFWESRVLGSCLAVYGQHAFLGCLRLLGVAFFTVLPLWFRLGLQCLCCYCSESDIVGADSVWMSLAALLPLWFGRGLQCWGVYMESSSSVSIFVSECQGCLGHPTIHSNWVDRVSVPSTLAGRMRRRPI
jgi:hypothetical protein